MKWNWTECVRFTVFTVCVYVSVNVHEWLFVCLRHYFINPLKIGNSRARMNSEWVCAFCAICDGVDSIYENMQTHSFPTNKCSFLWCKTNENRNGGVIVLVCVWETEIIFIAHVHLHYIDLYLAITVFLCSIFFVVVK